MVPRLGATTTRTSYVILDAGQRLPQVLPGVDLPSTDEIPEVIRHDFTDNRVALFLGASIQGTAARMLGKPKDDKSATTVAQRNILSSQKIAAKIPNPSDYKFFGNGNHSKNLVYLLKTNPFMAAALTEARWGFELRAFDKSDPEAKDASASLFRRITSCLGGAAHLVNIRFSKNFRMTEIRVYEESTTNMIRRIVIDENTSIEDIDYWASSALFNLGYYASCVHANIHVLHYLMTAALDESSQDFEAMNEWAKFYATNIPVKYEQVGKLLIRNQPNLLDILVEGRGNAGTVADTYALLTGSSGFGANGDKLRPILMELLNMWVNNPTNYVEKMINIPKDVMEQAGILTEFMKHHNLVPGYARGVKEALKATDEVKFGIAEKRLKVYLERCSGFNSKIDTLEDWIELMAVTGIVHGCTLSYSRLFADVDFLRWRDIQSSTWEAPDVSLHLRVLATVCGMDEHRHVMFSSKDIVGEKYDAKLQEVLETYETMANELKEAYKDEIMNDPDFNDYGWILSDFCPDGFDGKQLTVATYI